MEQPKINLKTSALSEMVNELNGLLSAEVFIYLKTRLFHWNVGGEGFYSLHKFFEAQYGELEGFMDDTAERVRALGGVARVTTEAIPGKCYSLDSSGMLEELLADHEEIITVLRDDIPKAEKLGDCGTVNYLSGLIEAHEKMAWMLRAFGDK